MINTKALILSDDELENIKLELEIIKKCMTFTYNNKLPTLRKLNELIENVK